MVLSIIIIPSMRDVDVNDNAGVIGDVSEKPKTLTKYFDPSIKEDVQLKGVAVVKYAMRNEASHAMTHEGGGDPGPCVGSSSFVGKSSSSEVIVKKSMI